MVDKYWEIAKVLESLDVWREHKDDKKPYHGLGLRPHNALWRLVVHCGVSYDVAKGTIDG